MLASYSHTLHVTAKFGLRERYRTSGLPWRSNTPSEHRQAGERGVRGDATIEIGQQCMPNDVHTNAYFTIISYSLVFRSTVPTLVAGCEVVYVNNNSMNDSACLFSL